MARPDSPQSEDIIRILHVDDETKQLEFAKTFIETSDPDIHMESVTAPKEALDKLRDEYFDCILSDYQMPDMDGIELARRIRETSDIPIIIYTGRGSEEVAEAAFTVGINDYLRKETNPSHYQVLARRIRTAVEKHRAENALKDSEGKYRSLVQNTRDGVMVFTGSELVYANKQAATLHGCSNVEELMKVWPSNLLHPEDREWIEERALAWQRGEDIPAISEFRLVLPDGTVRTVQSSSSLIEYSRKTSTLAFLRDVTEHKLYETRLEVLHAHALELASAEDMESIAELTLSAVENVFGYQWIDFNIVQDGCLVPLLISDEELRSNMTLSLDGPGIIVRAYMTGESQFVPDVRLDDDYVIGRGSGGEVWLSELAVPVKIGGEVVAVINIEDKQISAFTDHDRTLVELFAEHVASAISRIRRMGELEKAISDRELAERDLVEYTETLSATVEEKTQEVLDLERMSAAGKVAAMVGHDLRGPLQTIKNSLYLLERNPEKGAELREMMDEAVEYAVRMLDELRFKVSDSPLQLQEVNLGALIHGVVDEAAIPDFVKAEVHVDDGHGSVSMDPLKIRRVLDNLVRNALEAMPDGGSLGVSAVCEGDVVFIRVRDTGTGIPEELMPVLFKAFVTTKLKGMGLGLAYCKRAVEAHDGIISVESKVGEGTAFTVRLPMERK